MNICLCQYNIEWENKQKNKEKITKILSDIRNVQLIIFPEMALSGFSFNKKATTLTPDDIDFFASIAKSKNAFVCSGGVIEEKNSCLIINPSGDVVMAVAKIHLFSPSGEPSHHLPGSEIKSFTIGKVRVTPFICYDLRFSPLFWLSAAKTDIYVVIANWPSTRANHWKTLLVARAIENQTFVIGVNRIGISPKEQYCGDSCIVDPWGNMVFDACCEEGAFKCKIDASKVEQTRSRFPILNDRKRFAEYEKLLENE
ncbi:MAG: hypothetical protein NC931_02345 [Candidatus Omnitrophica bacterium]|nr:hypothetical protein [Candidatus Omnitrophota bacterium]MCM8822538.1 hypothetical protein [Candidatus Omnitrophota bacterium]MCM8827958.1 hypothetical protein [Candidatus Omnitrophota bacterium]